MKNLLLLLILLIFVRTVPAQMFCAAGETLKTSEGSMISVAEIFSGNTGTILVFWELNDPKSDDDLENLNETWIENLKSYGVNLVSVCIDKSGNWLAVKPYVSGKGWEFDSYIDVNARFRRVMGITETPYTILLDGDGNLKCRYPGYCSGDETRICDKILKCLKNNGTLANL